MKEVKVQIPLHGSSVAYRLHHHQSCFCGFLSTISIVWEELYTPDDLKEHFNMELPKEISYLKLKLK